MRLAIVEHGAGSETDHRDAMPGCDVFVLFHDSSEGARGMVIGQRECLPAWIDELASVYGVAVDQPSSELVGVQGDSGNAEEVAINEKCFAVSVASPGAEQKEASHRSGEVNGVLDRDEGAGQNEGDHQRGGSVERFEKGDESGTDESEVEHQGNDRGGLSLADRSAGARG